MKFVLNLCLSIGIFFLIFGIIGCDTLPFLKDEESQIKASGIVEVVEVVVAPEQAGRVAEVYVDEGDKVQTGDALFTIQGKILAAQQKQAHANLESAGANLITARAEIDLANAALSGTEANLEAAEANAAAQTLPIEQALKDLYDTAEVARADASRTVSGANKLVRDAQYQFDNFNIPVNQSEMTATEAIAVMKERLDQARQDFEPYKYKSSSDSTRKDLKDDLEDAQSDFDAAVRRMGYETNLEQAQASLDKAIQDLEILRDGPDPDDVAALEAQILAVEVAPRQAETVVEQAQAGVDRSQTGLIQAQAALRQSEAALSLIEVQMEQLLVDSPVDGVVLIRNVEPGEVIQPGFAAMNVGQLDQLTVTVYIQEDLYGQINLGDSAFVTTDSFPEESFNAAVIRIADKAEFTPRNVQTQEERRTTVFAIKLSVQDPDGKLKPGMPVDVEFVR